MSQAPTRPVMLWASGFIVACLGTVNLWKFDTIQNLVPFDLSLGTMSAALALSVVMIWRSPRGLGWGTAMLGLALMTPALLWTSFDHPYSVNKVQGLFVINMLCVLAPLATFRGHPSRTRFVVSMGLIAVVVAALILIFGVASTTAVGRVQVDEANPIALGRMASVGVVVFFAIFIRGRRRYTSAALLSLCAVAAMATGSRGPLGAAALALGVTLLTCTRTRMSSAISALLLIGGASLAISNFAPSAALERVLNADGSGDTARAHLATESLSIFWDNLLGVGWGDLEKHLSPAATLSVMADAQYSHNIILEVAAEGGILAVLGLGVLLVGSVRRIHRVRQSVTGSSILGLWVFALAGAMTSSDVVGNRLVFLMVGVGLSVGAVSAVPSVPAAPTRSGADSPVEADTSHRSVAKP